ncbi:response regulator [Ginsengibacter hankyongi]|uniref:histidine kinase n=1 Tax=Ginsengibacter hankyongi TaxID=2607284 RepID=A0A5J5II61_9BACT|nr:response regulator [Ginsengibacter hankyongi]KAA9038417.1 response regulator [Ginsengibacter hankyongi]
MIPEKDTLKKSDIKILVVDDREDNLFSIETVLEKDNYTIVKANSGRAALKILLKEYDFSLILMDVQMPDLNGFETATIIYERDKLKGIPIIFITAHNHEEEYIFKGYRMGAVDYIYKPVNQELLRAKVGVFVELYRKNRQLVVHEKKLLTANRSLQKEIEERKISEEKIKVLNKQLIANNAHLLAINEELDRFAYVASHDLQEPLRKIMVFSDKILSKQDNQSEVEKYLKKIVGSSQRMQSLINDLLEFSRHTVQTDDFVNINLNELVKEAMLELEIEIEKNNAQITIDDLPVIWAIPPLIRQLFYNLISNAIKFRKKDTVLAINISAEKIKNHLNANYYRLSVSDNGIGFDPAYADDIFVIFKRLHSYHEYQGSGVGLSICKKIVDKHNGFIRAIGKPGEGATFIVELPEVQPLPETS